jgi:hypothetical protein
MAMRRSDVSESCDPGEEDATRMLGRCIYCDERCNADSYYHDSCREDYDAEEQYSAQLHRLTVVDCEGND